MNWITKVLRIGVLAAGIMFGLDLSAAANLARFPVSVTQHYEDGSFSTFNCPLGFLVDTSPDCTLIVQEGEARVTADFNLLDLGYPYVTQQYKLFGSVKDGNITMSLEVVCSSEDNALHETIDDLHCNVIYELHDDLLIATRVDVRSESTDLSIFKSRSLPDSRNGN